MRFKTMITQSVDNNIDLARAKREALDNIYSLFKQNIKSCNAKRRRHATPENGEKQQKPLCTCSTLFCTFPCRCFARLLRETSRNFLVTRFMEEMSHVFPFTFFHCRSSSPCIGGR